MEKENSLCDLIAGYEDSLSKVEASIAEKKAQLRTCPPYGRDVLKLRRSLQSYYAIRRDLERTITTLKNYYK